MSTADSVPPAGAQDSEGAEVTPDVPPPGREQPPAPDNAPTGADSGKSASGQGGGHREEPDKPKDQPPDNGKPGQPASRKHDAEDEHGTEAVSVALFSEVMHSALATGSGNAYTLNLGTAKQAEIQRIPIRATEAARQHRLHCSVPDEKRMADALRSHHLVALAGPVGSGREDTGTFLLTQRCGSAYIARLHSEDADFLKTLVARARSHLQSGQGFLVNLGTRLPGQNTLEALSLLAREQEAHVVVIVDKGQTDSAASPPYTFRHHRPDLKQVLDRHLRSALDAHRVGCTEPEPCEGAKLDKFADAVLTHPDLSRKLDAIRQIAEVTSFADNLVRCVHDGAERAVHTLLDDPDKYFRALARRFLRLSDPQGDGRAPATETETHHQALRIAYVLGQDLPLSDVLRMGTLLSAEMLRAEYRETAPARPVFELDLDQLVAPGMGVAAHPDNHQSDNPRRARLTGPELMPAVIEVIWHGFGWLREPLLEWLRDLARDRLERVGARAAVIAGHLLRHDFDSVYRDLVKGWARSTSVRERRYAALALSVAMAADDSRLTAQVSRQVFDWTRSSRPQLQDSAARAYGTQLGVQDIPRTLWALQDLAGRPALAFYASVAYSTATLFLADGGAEPVADALGRWIRSDEGHLPQHAVRVLLVLGPFATGREYPFRPTLAHQALNASERRETLLLLWQRALIDPAHSGQAWQLLRQWLVVADEDEVFGEFLAGFVPQIWQPRLGRRRAQFYLSLWARQQPEAECTARLLRSLSSR